MLQQCGPELHKKRATNPILSEFACLSRDTLEKNFHHQAIMAIYFKNCPAGYDVGYSATRCWQFIIG